MHARKAKCGTSGWVATALTSVLAVLATSSPASGQSVETQAINGGTSCALSISQPLLDRIRTFDPRRPDQFVAKFYSEPYPVSVQADACRRAVGDTLTRVLSDTMRDASSMATLAVGAATETEVGELAFGTIGVIGAQKSSLNALRWSFGADLGNANAVASVEVLDHSYDIGARIAIDEYVGCLTCDDPSDALQVNQNNNEALLQEHREDRGGSSDDMVKNFIYSNSKDLRWVGKENGHVDGKSHYIVYFQGDRIHATLDFWAMSQAASVMPINGRRLKKVVTAIRPESSGLSGEEFAPTEVRKYGDGGSMTLNATLSGSGGNGSKGESVGASFGLSRTWNYSAGEAGGGQFSDDHTYASQFIFKGGSDTTKSAAGVTTWKAPKDAPTTWHIEAVATTKKP